MTIRKRLRSLLWRVPIEQEVQDELAHHVELRTQRADRARRRLLTKRARIAQTATGERTRREGADATGPAAQRLRGRDATGSTRLRQDVTFALRQCRRRPGFTVAAVLTLGLGIGATTAIFSVVHAVVLRPYSFADPDRVLVAESTWRGRPGGWSVGNFDYFRQRLDLDRTVRGIGADQFQSRR